MVRKRILGLLILVVFVFVIASRYESFFEFWNFVAFYADVANTIIWPGKHDRGVSGKFGTLLRQRWEKTINFDIQGQEVLERVDRGPVIVMVNHHPNIRLDTSVPFFFLPKAQVLVAMIIPAPLASLVCDKLFIASCSGGVPGLISQLQSAKTQGNDFIMYPEGTAKMPSDAPMQPLRTGGFRGSFATLMPVVPMIVGPLRLPPTSGSPEDADPKGKCVVRVCDPVYPQDFETAEDMHAHVSEVMATCRLEVLALSPVRE